MCARGAANQKKNRYDARIISSSPFLTKPSYGALVGLIPKSGRESTEQLSNYDITCVMNRPYSVRSALRLVHGPPRTATPLQRLLPAKATTISSNTSSIQLASRIIRRERSQVFDAGVVDFPSPLKQPVLLVFLNTILQVLERLASSLLFAPLFLMTELQMALFSATR